MNEEKEDRKNGSAFDTSNTGREKRFILCARATKSAIKHPFSRSCDYRRANPSESGLTLTNGETRAPLDRPRDDPHTHMVESAESL